MGSRTIDFLDRIRRWFFLFCALEALWRSQQISTSICGWKSQQNIENQWFCFELQFRRKPREQSRNTPVCGSAKVPEKNNISQNTKYLSSEFTDHRFPAMELGGFRSLFSIDLRFLRATGTLWTEAQCSGWTPSFHKRSHSKETLVLNNVSISQSKKSLISGLHPPRGSGSSTAHNQEICLQRLRTTGKIVKISQARLKFLI